MNRKDKRFALLLKLPLYLWTVLFVLAGNLIQSLMKSRDLPMASALSVLMLAVTGAVIALYRRAGGDADGLGLF